MVLHGWKQIAQYLGCGIRTAQRWESQCGLPVTRPRNHLRSPVLAQSEALDSWAGGASTGATEHWETRCEKLEREVEFLKRQVLLLAGSEPVEEVAGTAAEHGRRRAAGAGRQPMAATPAGFDA